MSDNSLKFNELIESYNAQLQQLEDLRQSMFNQLEQTEKEKNQDDLEDKSKDNTKKE